MQVPNNSEIRYLGFGKSNNSNSTGFGKYMIIGYLGPLGPQGLLCLGVCCSASFPELLRVLGSSASRFVNVNCERLHPNHSYTCCGRRSVQEQCLV